MVVDMKKELSAKSSPDYSILKPIANRWSGRAYSAEPVEEAVLMRIFEAARWAPSSFNEQPWRFVYAIQGEPAWDKLSETLLEGNAWARKAPVLVLSVVKTFHNHNLKQNKFAWHDVGQAIALLSIQATAEGLNLHQMGGFDSAKARGFFDIGEGFEPVSIIAIGYRDEPDKLNNELKARELTPQRRIPVSQFAYKGFWKM
jgi:nitroreductase